eukprot:NODE_1029_length_1932_cov_81.796573_g978_i0.p1 GENE.NODE_1029_length_1932_cov_81.796573_g978_i0~~NODE_1029_length_1932_cov_81.796573_g978_i0.p1  ORF type:complete len:366 (+),score=64.39 NODE_1029_length_1932_cov_81.796573_g978_i0:54-1100(+)
MFFVVYSLTARLRPKDDQQCALTIFTGPPTSDMTIRFQPKLGLEKGHQRVTQALPQSIGNTQQLFFTIVHQVEGEIGRMVMDTAAVFYGMFDVDVACSNGRSVQIRAYASASSYTPRKLTAHHTTNHGGSIETGAGLWQWQSNDKNVWHSYPPHHQDILERAWKAKCLSVRISRLYSADLKYCMQRNERTKRDRPMRRKAGVFQWFGLTAEKGLVEFDPVINQTLEAAYHQYDPSGGNQPFEELAQQLVEQRDTQLAGTLNKSCLRLPALWYRQTTTTTGTPAVQLMDAHTSDQLETANSQQQARVVLRHCTADIKAMTLTSPTGVERIWRLPMFRWLYQHGEQLLPL